MGAAWTQASMIPRPPMLQCLWKHPLIRPEPALGRYASRGGTFSHEGRREIWWSWASWCAPATPSQPPPSRGRCSLSGWGVLMLLPIVIAGLVPAIHTSACTELSHGSPHHPLPRGEKGDLVVVGLLVRPRHPLQPPPSRGRCGAVSLAPSCPIHRTAPPPRWGRLGGGGAPPTSLSTVSPDHASFPSPPLAIRPGCRDIRLRETELPCPPFASW